jgi:hypothetical protein
MTPDALQQLCETGQEQLMRMDYLAAEATLAEAERVAWAGRDWDALHRLYMPLQEARRQRRQRCGEGVVRLDLLAEGPGDAPSAERVVGNDPHGQLLVAGWGSVAPALAVRELQAKHNLFVETFLAAVYPIGFGVPLPDVELPPPDPQPIDQLLPNLPPHSLVLAESELPRGPRKGTTGTYAEVMALWERLHTPFLAAADMQVDPVQKMDGYRRTIRVDYASELAHQKLSNVAREMLRRAREKAG